MNKTNCLQVDDKKEIECIADDNDCEKCWQEKYKGDSRKWLIRDGSFKLPHNPLCSTMKDSYKHIRHHDEIAEIIGHKKVLLLKQFEQEAINEVLEECEKPPTIEEYCTEYDRSFNISDFEPDDEPFKRQEELYKKYPLYSSVPTSYYSYKVLNQQPKKYVHGFTKITDNNQPFKKFAKFSKPINEVLDEMSR